MRKFPFRFKLGCHRGFRFGFGCGNHVFLLKEEWSTFRRSLPEGDETQLQNFQLQGGAVNLRRRDWDEFRPAKNCWERVGNYWSFSFPADAAVSRIFKNYTTFIELFTDAIGGCKVACLTRHLPFSDKFFYLRVPSVGASLCIAQDLKFLRIIIFEHCEDLVECLQKLLRGGRVGAAKLTFVHGNVRFAHKFKHRSQSTRGIQVVRQAGIKFFGRLRDSFGHAFLQARWELALRHAIYEIPEPIYRTGGLLQSVK